MKKEINIFLEHILESIDNIHEFIGGISKKDFFNNKEKQSAVIRQIEIIGEAVKNLPVNFKQQNPKVPWIDIAGMRDKLIHHYFGVDLDTVWLVIKNELPKLKKEIVKIKKELNE